MPDTTFITKVTKITAEWLQEVNNLVFRIGSTASPSYGAALVAWNPTEAYTGGVGAILRYFFGRTAGEVAASVTPTNYGYAPGDVRRYGADETGATNSNAALQACINANTVTVVPPGTWAITTDITIPANRKIWVQKRATVTNTGGRFTAYDVDNVEWQIDGWVESVSLAIVGGKTGWPTNPAQTYTERGFLEFGSATLTARKGFWVHGTGKVSGDWTGTPNVSDFSNQMNRKGIAAWNAADVLVEGLEVFGFHGEAVYAFFFDTSSQNIVFRHNNVHDTRFNALNFNAATNGGNCKIHHNRVKAAYAVESSVGEVTDNFLDGCVGIGIWTGVGAGMGPIVISRNTIINTGPTAGAHGIATVFASGSPVSDIEICDNVIVNSNDYSIYTDYIREFTIRGNKCIGTGQGQGSYDIGINHALRGSVSENTFLSPGASAQAGRISIDANSFDVSVCRDSNVYLATTGTAPPVVRNGVITLNSSVAGTLPVLGSVFFITGTDGITSISATNNNGRKVTLIFEGALTLTDGSNLKLAGNLTTSADDTITLVCNGTNWYEVCRSVN